MSSWLKFVPEILCVQNSINILQNKGKVTRKWREVIFAATSAYPGLGHYQSPLSGMLLLVTAHGLGKEIKETVHSLNMKYFTCHLYILSIHKVCVPRKTSY